MKYELGIVTCFTTQTIYENKRTNTESLLRRWKNLSSSKSLSSWQRFVKRWPIKSTIGGQADNHNRGRRPARPFAMLANDATGSAVCRMSALGR